MEEDSASFRPDVDALMNQAARLAQLNPGSDNGGVELEQMAAQLSRRFDSVCDKVQRRAERLDIAKRRNLEVIFFF